ncbi:MAG: ORF6N domain-containing protein [Lachnospiraceae bacterium]|nr:ORF6N domain-containing protein [Lachnospiraceae bacterium]
MANRKNGSEEKLSESIAVTEEYLRDKIYEVRGYKVMLDADLAEIYGYDTKSLNRQVKNNISKFDDDFMFELTDQEVEDLRCNNCTANIDSKSRYNPHVFTEQGLYMLMTVLHGELAARQSKALIRTFKKMKDYIISRSNLIGQRDLMKMSIQTMGNAAEIKKLRADIDSVEKQMFYVMNQLDEVVTKSDLSDMMNSFVNDEDNGWLMFNTQYCSADIAYSTIYGQAKKSVYLIDNYIGLRTLVMLKNAPEGTDIRIFSDNIGTGKLHKVEYDDFCREYTYIRLSLQHTGGFIHDRFIVLDYGTENERVFLCGASSKDAGGRITGIVEDYGIEKYKPMIEKLLKNEKLRLQ